VDVFQSIAEHVRDRLTWQMADGSIVFQFVDSSQFLQTTTRVLDSDGKGISHHLFLGYCHAHFDGTGSTFRNYMGCHQYTSVSNIDRNQYGVAQEIQFPTTYDKYSVVRWIKTFKRLLMRSLIFPLARLRPRRLSMNVPIKIILGPAAAGSYSLTYEVAATTATGGFFYRFRANQNLGLFHSLWRCGASHKDLLNPYFTAWAQVFFLTCERLDDHRPMGMVFLANGIYEFFRQQSTRVF